MEKPIKEQVLKAIAEHGDQAFSHFNGVAFHADGDEIGEFPLHSNKSLCKALFDVGFSVRAKA